MKLNESMSIFLYILPLFCIYIDLASRSKLIIQHWKGERFIYFLRSVLNKCNLLNRTLACSILLIFNDLQITTSSL